MASLFERIVNPPPTVIKIPVHGVRAMVSELVRGDATVQDLIDVFELDDGQQTDLYTFLSKVNAHPDKMYISAVVFDWLALAELGVKPEIYRNESLFYTRIDAEVASAAV